MSVNTIYNLIFIVSIILITTTSSQANPKTSENSKVPSPSRDRKMLSHHDLENRLSTGGSYHELYHVVHPSPKSRRFSHRDLEEISAGQNPFSTSDEPGRELGTCVPPRGEPSILKQWLGQEYIIQWRFQILLNIELFQGALEIKIKNKNV
ncbi:hypothetical protein CASFOL_041435 [Castilleja foliolosa]|uniref:Uncharacterized protein n=1 Tax=Castilleja foliolosa TaxID=1961234 RepID=A0ABD3BBC6_9LAMI